ncbi:hypothetical protein Tco_0246539 [Tanacetum coccineum]
MEYNSSVENNRILEELLRTSNTNSLIGARVPEGSDDYTEVTYDKEQYLSDHYTAHVTPFAYIPSIPFLATMEPVDTLLMGEGGGMRKQVVDFLMENVDVAGLPRHLVMYLFNHLIKNPSLTKGMSDEPLGDDSKPRSYDVILIRCLEDQLPRTSDLILEELTTDIVLYDSISTDIDDRYYDSGGDILYFEQLLNKDTSSDVSPALLPTKSSLLVPNHCPEPQTIDA